MATRRTLEADYLHQEPTFFTEMIEKFRSKTKDSKNNCLDIPPDMKKGNVFERFVFFLRMQLALQIIIINSQLQSSRPFSLPCPSILRHNFNPFWYQFSVFASPYNSSYVSFDPTKMRDEKYLFDMSSAFCKWVKQDEPFAKTKKKQKLIWYLVFIFRAHSSITLMNFLIPTFIHRLSKTKSDCFIWDMNVRRKAKINEIRKCVKRSYIAAYAARVRLNKKLQNVEDILNIKYVNTGIRGVAGDGGAYAGILKRKSKKGVQGEKRRCDQIVSKTVRRILQYIETAEESWNSLEECMKSKNDVTYDLNEKVSKLLDAHDGIGITSSKELCGAIELINNNFLRDSEDVLWMKMQYKFQTGAGALAPVQNIAKSVGIRSDKKNEFNILERLEHKFKENGKAGSQLKRFQRDIQNINEQIDRKNNYLKGKSKMIPMDGDSTAMIQVQACEFRQFLNHLKKMKPKFKVKQEVDIEDQMNCKSTSRVIIDEVYDDFTYLVKYDNKKKKIVHETMICDMYSNGEKPERNHAEILRLIREVKLSRDLRKIRYIQKVFYPVEPSEHVYKGKSFNASDRQMMINALLEAETKTLLQID